MNKFETEDRRTEIELIMEAESAQDACNASGVILSFAKAMNRLIAIGHERGEGTAWRNRHPVVQMYAQKIAQLAGDPDWAAIAFAISCHKSNLAMMEREHAPYLVAATKEEREILAKQYNQSLEDALEETFGKGNVGVVTLGD